jgi:glucokinase
MIVLAGDIGGTNSRFALFRVDRGGDGKPALVMLFERTYPSAAHLSLEEIGEIFLADARAKLGGATPGGLHVDKACFGIAGPVENNICRATNLPWVVDGRVLSRLLGIGRVLLVNDFFAAALGVTAVGPDHMARLGGAPPVAEGPIAVLGAGTGLGEAFLLWSPAEAAYRVVPSEGGHADFAPRTPLETGLFSYLSTKYGRVSYERILSGQGLVDVFSFLAQEPACKLLVRDHTAAALALQGPGHDPAAAISQRGLDGSDPVCEMALAIFCSVLGAVAGNLGLYVLATGGVFIAGGIAPRVIPYLQKGGFREAFEHKGRLHPLVAALPAFVVTHPQPGLLGAATCASGL